MNSRVFHDWNSQEKKCLMGAKKHRKVTEVGDSEDKKKVLNKSNQ